MGACNGKSTAPVNNEVTDTQKAVADDLQTADIVEPEEENIYTEDNLVGVCSHISACLRASFLLMECIVVFDFEMHNYCIFI